MYALRRNYLHFYKESSVTSSVVLCRTIHAHAVLAKQHERGRVHKQEGTESRTSNCIGGTLATPMQELQGVEHDTGLSERPRPKRELFKQKMLAAASEWAARHGAVPQDVRGCVWAPPPRYFFQDGTRIGDVP